MSSTLNSALNGLNAAKLQMSIAAQNIAGEGKDYSRIGVVKTPIVLGGKPQGVDILAVQTFTDSGLQDSLLNKISSDEYSTIILKYAQQMQLLFGKPGEVVGIDTSITQFLNSLQQLGADTSSPVLKNIAINEANNLIQKISGLAQSLQELRFNVDTQIATVTDDVNTALSQAYNYNLAIQTFNIGTIEKVNFEDQFRKSLETLSQYFNITKTVDKSGYRVFLSDGSTIVSPNSRYELQYVPQTSANSIIQGGSFQAMQLTAVDASGNTSVNSAKNIATAGISSNVQSTFEGGQLKALLNVRDTQIPNLLAQLDTFAVGIKQAFNSIHNNGTGFPGYQTLTGTNPASRNLSYGFNGTVRFAALTTDGKAISTIQPLDLDLSTLDTGSGPGQANMEGIIQEINYHFGSRLTSQASVTFGGLSDIKITSVSSAITASQNLELDLELANYFKNNTTVTINSATATDQLATNILSSFNNSPFTVNSGQKIRTGMSGPSLVLTNQASINYPYTITLNITANDGTGPIISDVAFTINNPDSNTINGIKNQRFGPSSSTIGYQAPTFSTPAMVASLVDDQGNYSADGFLRINSSSSSYNFAIDNLTSTQTGNLNSNIVGTNSNFNYFFGLNDLFTRSDVTTNWSDTTNTALYLQVRPDIVQNPRLFATAKLQQLVDETNPVTSTVPIYLYEVGDLNNDNLSAMLGIFNQKYNFAAIGGLPATSTTLNGYAASIIGNNVSLANLAQSNADQTSKIRSALADNIQNIRGVDLNEELANLTILQTNFSASAKVFSAVQKMDEILLNTIRG